MNFTSKQFKEEYPEYMANGWDMKAVAWVAKNKKLVKEEFKSLFPKASNDFVVQIETTRGSVLLTSEGTVKPKKSGAFLDFEALEKLGYEY